MASTCSWRRLHAFKQTAEGYDGKDAGVAAEGVPEVSRFHQKMSTRQVISADMDYSVAESEFVAGNVAMTISGQLGLGNDIERKLALTTSVTTLPKFNGKDV